MAHVRKQFILDSNKIRKVRKLVGASTDTEAVNRALDALIENAEIRDVHRKLAGHCNIRDMDQSKFSG